MMRRWQVGLALLAGWLVTAGALVPAAAAEETSSYVVSTFETKASHGYTLTVVAGPSLSSPTEGEVTVTLSRGGTSATYSAPASVTPTSINSDLGRLGRISVNFVASGSTTQRTLCHRSQAFDAGSFEGDIEFHGEGSYADVTATKVEGFVGPLSSFFCTGGGPAETWGADTPGAKLRVRTAKLRNGFLLEVSKNFRKARVPYFAATEEQIGVVSVERTVEGWAGPGAFTFDPRLRTAMLTLPAPFIGRAEFNRHAAHGRQWSGSLSVNFPGHPHARLTGTRASAKLVHREIYG